MARFQEARTARDAETDRSEVSGRRELLCDKLQCAGTLPKEATTPTRRRFLKTAGVTATGALLATASSGRGRRKFNVLWIIAEDMCPNMSCYGETAIKTPHIDRLAAEGARFDSAFVTAPVCSPSRSAMITGMYQTSIGAHNHRSSRGSVKIHLPAHVKLIPEYFRQAGYYTSLGGRVDNDDYRRRVDPRMRLGKSDYNFVWSEEVYDSNDWSGRKPGQPFFAQIQLDGGKHRGARVPNPVDPNRVRLPPYYPNHPILREDWARYLNSVINTDIEIGQILDRLEDEGITDNTIIFFWTDHGIAHVRAKRFLYDSGIRVPLIVRWPGGIKPGTVREDLVSHIDVAATSLYMAGINVPDYMEGRPLFGPGYKPRDYIIAARDRADDAVDRIRCVRDHDFKYIRNYFPERSTMYAAGGSRGNPVIITMCQLYTEGKLNPTQARLFEPTRPVEELYDVDADPHEINNLAGLEEHRETLKRMRAILEEWIKTTGDQGQFPESKESLEEVGRVGHSDIRTGLTAAERMTK